MPCLSVNPVGGLADVPGLANPVVGRPEFVRGRVAADVLDCVKGLLKEVPGRGAVCIELCSNSKSPAPALLDNGLRALESGDVRSGAMSLGREDYSINQSSAGTGQVGSHLPPRALCRQPSFSKLWLVL